MGSQSTVYISYNPNSEAEQTLALRLHTIGAVHGFNMILPDRSLNSNSISNETRGRINLSDLFVVFSTDPLSPVVLEEINIAFAKHHNKSKILVIYDQSKGRILHGLENCTELFIDPRQDLLKNVTDIADRLKSLSTSKGNGISTGFGAILLIGIGLFALAEAFDTPSKPKKKTKVTRKKRPARA